MRNSMERPTLKVEINGQDIPDFYYMLRWFARNKGNTFTYIKQQLETMYPELPKAYGTTSED